MAQTKHEERVRVALGERLASAREIRGLSLEQVAAELRRRGVPYGKAAVGAWEKGRNVPDAIVVGELALIYQQTVDALLWDTAISVDGAKIAVQFDSLRPDQQDRLLAIFKAFFQEAASDAEVESKMPVTASLKKQREMQE